MLQKAAEAKLVRKAQRQAAMDAAKLAKRERGYLRLMLLISLIGLSVTQVRVQWGKWLDSNLQKNLTRLNW